MPCRLTKEEVVSIGVLSTRGFNNCEIARTLEVSEGTVRYHRNRLAEGAVDGRSKQPFQAESKAELIRLWFEDHEEDKRPVNVRDLYEHLLLDHKYRGSYKSVLRYVRTHYPAPKIRTYRRVETPAGAQAQVDWVVCPNVDVGEGPEVINGFIMKLSHSRKPAVVWSRRQDQLSWLNCHNGGFRRLGGIPAVCRIDNTKTAIISGAGAWGQIHPVYRAYALAVRFHIDACAPRAPEAKGKVEAAAKLTQLRWDPRRRSWDGLEELQNRTDRDLERWTRTAICPATGLSVYESWQGELELLQPLPLLPEPFDVVVSRPVYHDCRVSFEGRSYPVPFEYTGEEVEVRGCVGKVQILADGQVLREFPRGTAERILIDPSCYEGEATDRVLPPTPLGKMGRKLQEIYEMAVEERPVDLYAALAEVAR